VFLNIFYNNITAANYYISTTGNDATGNGTSGTPYLTLAKVFSAHNLASGDIIYVAAGTYTEKNITIGSDDEGFTIQGAALDGSGNHTSIFDSDQTAIWLNFADNNNDNITIDKIKIKDYKSNFSAANGGAIYVNLTDCIGITISNCYFDNCDAGNGYKGGAIFFLFNVSGSSNLWTLNNNIFTNCDASAGGGAIYIGSASEFDLTISKCKIYGNTTSAASGSAIYFDGSSGSIMTMTNCLVYGNTLSGNNHGTIYIHTNADANIYNSTIVNNTAQNSYTGGVYFADGGSTFTNCILYGNTYRDVTRTAGTITLNNCCYQNSTSNGVTLVNSITTNPNLNGTYHLNSGSPCIDAGTGTPGTNPYPNDDLDNLGRVAPIDIGCYEFNGVTLPIDLAFFNANCDNKYVKLRWATFTENQNDFFTIEKSKDAIHFYEIAKIKGNGSSNQAHYYRFFDEQSLPGLVYYRLKQVDFNGASTLFPIQTINCFIEDNEISVYPNPNNGSFEIKGIQSDEKVLVYDAIGKLIEEKIATSNAISFSLLDVEEGVYFVQVKNKTGISYFRKIILQK
jgi:hypothetical protein